MRFNDIVLGDANVPGITDTEPNGIVRLSGANERLRAQAINNYNSPKTVYGNQIDNDNAKDILKTTGYNYIYTDSDGFEKPTSFNSNDIILGGPTVTGILDSELNGATRLGETDSSEIKKLVENYSAAKNVFGMSIDVQNAKRYLGTIDYNYIEIDQTGFIKPSSFSCNDIILGSDKFTNILDGELNGASRYYGNDRYETNKKIRELAGIKHVICADKDLINAKVILGTTGEYEYKNITEIPSILDSTMIVLGGIAVTGITDKQLNGAIRLWGDTEELTAQAINNYKSPKYVYGAQVDIDNAKEILGSTGHTYILLTSTVDSNTYFGSNDIILGSPDGITDIQLNGAMKLCGADRIETKNLVRNYSKAKNVFGLSLDIQNAKRYLGTIDYNFIEIDQPGFIKPSSFSKNDIILGGADLTKISEDEAEKKYATRLAGTDRNETIKLIMGLVKIKYVIGAEKDINNAKSILGTAGEYEYQNTTENPNVNYPLNSNTIVLGGPEVTKITDDKLNGAIRLWGDTEKLTAQAINNYNSPKYVYGAKVDIENAKKILGSLGHTYIVLPSRYVKNDTTFTYNEIVLGGPSVTGITDEQLKGAIRVFGANKDKTIIEIENYSKSLNIYGAKVDIDNASKLLKGIVYNYIDTGYLNSDLTETPVFPTFTCNDIILGEIANKVDLNKNYGVDGATGITGLDAPDTLKRVSEYFKVPIVTPGTGGGTSADWRKKIVDEATYWCQPEHHLIYGSDTNHARLHLMDRNSPPAYIDCSEFTACVYYTVFNKAINIGTCCGFNKLYPSETQELKGTRVSSIADLKPGDLMFFDWDSTHNEDGIDHVAIYLGDNKIATTHGSNKNKGYTSVTDLAGDYVTCFVEGSRIIQDDNTYINKPAEGKIPLPGSGTTQPPTSGTVYAKACSDSGDHAGELTPEQKNANALYIYNYLHDNYNWSKNAICGLLGNMEQESHMNPGCWENWDNMEVNNGYGLVQWTLSTSTEKKYLQWKGLTAQQADALAQNDPKQLMESQLEFMLKELDPNAGYWTWGDFHHRAPEKYSGFTVNDYITSNLSASELADVWQYYYERPTNIDTNREGYANTWYDYLTSLGK